MFQKIALIVVFAGVSAGSATSQARSELGGNRRASHRWVWRTTAREPLGVGAPTSPHRHRPPRRTGNRSGRARGKGLGNRDPSRCRSSSPRTPSRITVMKSSDSWCEARNRWPSVLPPTSFADLLLLPSLEMREAYARALRFPEGLDHPRFRSQFAPDIYAFLRETWRSPQSIPWGIGATTRMEVVRRKVRRFIEAGGIEQLVAGTDAGSPLNHASVPREIAHLVDAGLSPMQAIQSATLRPAQMQGVDDRLGTIAVGKLADIIVVDGNPLDDISLLQYRVSRVIKGGVVYK